MRTSSRRDADHRISQPPEISPSGSGKAMNGSRSARRDRVLLADIGGTNARFALAERDEIGPIEHFKVTDFSSATDVIAAFLTRHAGGSPEAAVMGVAGPVENNRCTITNSGWMIDGSDLQTRFGFKVVRLLNDFAAAAWSLPALQPSDLLPVGQQRPIAGAPMSGYRLRRSLPLPRRAIRSGHRSRPCDVTCDLGEGGARHWPTAAAL